MRYCEPDKGQGRDAPFLPRGQFFFHLVLLLTDLVRPIRRRKCVPGRDKRLSFDFGMPLALVEDHSQLSGPSPANDGPTPPTCRVARTVNDSAGAAARI